MSDFEADVDAGTLPNVAILDPSYTGSGQNDEHPPANPQLGQELTGRLLEKVMSNPAVWQKTVFILCYDEHGGFYDHVPPPRRGWRRRARVGRRGAARSRLGRCNPITTVRRARRTTTRRPCGFVSTRRRRVRATPSTIISDS